MILSFGDQATEDLFHGRTTNRTRRFPQSLIRQALRKLDLINGADELLDLLSAPGNRLERLRGDLEGHYSIRVNDQWRVIFRWDGNDASDISLVDYH